jgi:hypothetical protein
MRSIKSFIDEGFEVIVHKESDVKPKPCPNPTKTKMWWNGKEVELTLGDEDIALGECDYCGKGRLQINAALAFLGSDNNRKLAFVHDGCYVAAMCEWGLTENA